MPVIDIVDDNSFEMVVPIEERLGVKALAAIIMYFESNGIEKYDEIVNAFNGRSFYTCSIMKLDLDLKNKTTLPTKSSIKDPLKL